MLDISNTELHDIVCMHGCSHCNTHCREESINRIKPRTEQICIQNTIENNTFTYNQDILPHVHYICMHGVCTDGLQYKYAHTNMYTHLRNF